MGIADDIVPRRKERPATPELDSLDVPVAVREPRNETKAKEVEAVFERKPSQDDDFFPPAKTTTKKADIAIIAESKKAQPSQPAGKSRQKLVLLLLIVVAGILIYYYYGQIKTAIFGKSSGSGSGSSVTIVPQDYTSGSSTSTTTPASTTPDSTVSTPATTPTATATPAVPDKSTLTINLLNGNGISSTAATYKSVLTKAGYTVSAVGNAQNFKYWSTYVYYKTGLDATAADLKTVLKRKSTLLKNDDTICNKYDIVIIIGSH